MLDVRQADNEEWVAATRKPTLKALLDVLYFPEMDVTGAYLDGECVAIWGCHDTPNHFGQVWLIATNRAMRHVHSIHHHWRPTIQRYLGAHPKGLIGWASEANTKHHTWLERMGFVNTGTVLYAGSFPYRRYFLRGPEPCALPSLP